MTTPQGDLTMRAYPPPVSSFRLLAGVVPCSSCGSKAEPVDCYVVRSRPNEPPLDEIFPPNLRGVITNGQCVVHLCDECADIASTPLGVPFGATAEPAFIVTHRLRGTSLPPLKIA
jgi:hypothetical protein